MALLLGALTVGLIFSLLALGIYISYRVFDVADITVDGSITLGAAICAVLLVRGTSPLVASFASLLGGFAAGSVTGLQQAKFKINPLLSGMLVMTGLYSVNLHVMGKSNVPLLFTASLTSLAERWGQTWLGRPEVNLPGWTERSAFIAREGALDFFHLDYYTQVLSKILRRQRKDVEDVRSMREAGTGGSRRSRRSRPVVSIERTLARLTT